MKDGELEVLLLNSQNEEEQAIERLLEKYRGMIHAYSFVNGEIQEELKQGLIEETIKAIKRFKIERGDDCAEKYKCHLSKDKSKF